MGSGGASRSTGLDRDLVPPLGVQVRMYALSHSFSSSEY